MNRGVMKCPLVVLSMGAVPSIMLAVYITGGAIEPHLPGQKDTWNIQYLLHFTTAVFAALLAVRYVSVIGKVWCWIIVSWNAVLAALAVYATISLWGDMY